MPLSKYNSLFGGNAEKAFKSMKSQYGEDKGKSVFYASVNKKKKRKKDVIQRRARNGS